MGRKASPAIPSWQRVDTYPAQRIGEKMEKMHISSTAMAEHLNCSPQAVNQYKRGDAFPTCQNLMKIAQRLGTTTDYLLGAAECEDPDNEKVHKMLGLSEDAIEALKELSQTRDEILMLLDKPLIETINTLIATDAGRRALRHIASYLGGSFWRPYIESRDGTPNEITQLYVKSDLGEVPISVPLGALSESMLALVADDLRTLKRQEAKKHVNPENPE